MLNETFNPIHPIIIRTNASDVASAPSQSLNLYLPIYLSKNIKKKSGERDQINLSTKINTSLKCFF